MEHRRRKRGMGSIANMFDGVGEGIGDVLGLSIDTGAAMDMLTAGAAGAAGLKVAMQIEDRYPQFIQQRAWAIPALRAALGVGAALGFAKAKFPGSRSLAMGLGVTLTASGLLDLWTVVQGGGVAVAAETVQGLGERPIQISERSLNEAPLTVRDVSETEQQIQDFAYLQ